MSTHCWSGVRLPEPVQQIGLALIEGAPLAPATGVGHRVIGVAVPAGRVARLGVDRPVAAFDVTVGHVGDEGVLPRRVGAHGYVAEAVAVADAGLARGPVEIAAE